jgi:predicted metal-binding transcription factor (methanogenesis marker protein 9)
MKKTKDCYIGIFSKIDHIEERITQIKEQLAELRLGFIKSDDEAAEVCMDEIEAEKALLEIVSENALEALLETDPQGDA